MGVVIALSAFFCVFFIRDVQLLSVAPSDSVATRLKLYALCGLSYAVLLMAALRGMEGQPWQRILRSAPFGIAGVLWHGLIWLCCLWLKRRSIKARWWVVTLLPAPVFLACVITLAFLLHGVIGTVAPLLLAVAIMGGWCTAIALTVAWVKRQPPDALESRFAVDFAGVANATALLLMPFGEAFSGF